MNRPLCFIDTETTGLDPNVAEVIEIAISRREPDGSESHYYTLVQPENIEAASPKALEMNGYQDDPSRWLNAPPLAEVGESILSFLDGGILVGHNVGFDEQMLSANLKRAGVAGRVPYHKIDTVTLVYEHLFPQGLEWASLGAVRTFLGWDSTGAHTAQKDVEDTMRLFDLLWRSGTSSIPER